jgi:sulfatase maturation enzyme AslB (radical SAM superfamily)
MPPQQLFNFDFDKEHGQKLIEVVQLNVGCFGCNKPNPDKTCSRCQVNMYCNQECQKTDWKMSGENAGLHKHLCQTYCENRAEQHGVMGPIPSCLFSIHLN